MYAIGLSDFCCTEPVLLICSYWLLKSIIELLFLTIISMLEARRCFGVAPPNVGMAAKGPELSLSPGVQARALDIGWAWLFWFQACINT